ncbi:FecR family protein [Ravibacter arvi]|uniref:FecR family protein n=1 Tax=Ravibacter arvi TaxID=2051041 RepID=A0ABP8M029_9BACT
MYRDYDRFEIEDFAFDESFQRWVNDVHADHADFWNNYLAEHPHQLDKILAARDLVLRLKESENPEIHTQLSETIWANVKSHADLAEKKRIMRRAWLSAAAAALLAVAAFAYFVGAPGKSRPAGPSSGLEVTSAGMDMIDFVADKGKADSVVLADGSTVVVEKNSRITYSARFGGRERVVHLNGEATFDVVKNPERPFLIFANKAVVKVLGTRFRVKAYDRSEKVVVAVRSGKVSVFEKKDFERNRSDPQLPGLILTANQQAEFSTEFEKFSKMLVPDPVLMTGVNRSEFEFDRTPLPEVFETLEKAYGVEIIYDRSLFAHRLLKVSLEDESLTEKLDIICKTMGLSYQIIDARIVIEKR